MSDDKAIDKARKLQAMAEGGEDNEAAVAREMLAAMLERHSLTLDDLVASATASVTISPDAEADDHALPERRARVAFGLLSDDRMEIARQVLLHMPRGREVTFEADYYGTDLIAFVPESMAALAVTSVELAFKAYEGTLAAISARHERERKWLLTGFLEVNGIRPYAPQEAGHAEPSVDEPQEFRARMAAKDDCYSIPSVSRLMPALLPSNPSPTPQS